MGMILFLERPDYRRTQAPEQKKRSLLCGLESKYHHSRHSAKNL